jgi:hypothetical protein
MVRVRDVAWAFAILALTLAGPHAALADPITLTGNVASDFTTANGSVTVPVNIGPGAIDGPTGSTANQLVAGVDIKNIWLNYNASTDTMNVGIQGYKNVAGQEEIFGDLSGNPNPALDPNPNFGGLKSVAIAFAPVTQNAQGHNVAGTPSIIAGVPQTKPPTASASAPYFIVSPYSANATGLEFSFGQPLSGAGSLAFNPSAAHPDFEFTLNNFSKISGINPANGLYLEAYAGTPGNADGKLQTSWIFSPAAQQPIGAPEPTTWLAWLLLAGGAGWRYRRRLTG